MQFELFSLSEVLSKRKVTSLSSMESYYRSKINRINRNKIHNQIPINKLKHNLRHRIRNLIKRLNLGKKVGFTKTVGCDGETLKNYLESKFKPGMSWENYGKWHVDHIRPVSSFDLNSLEGQSQVNHYTNLQPLWAEENLKKSNKIVAKTIQSL